MGYAIEISGLVKFYGSVRALDGLDLGVEEGEVHGFLGPNGAGKTTTIRILTGLLKPDDGTAHIFGKDAAGSSSVRTNVGYMPELASFPSHLTGRELLDIYGKLYGLGKDERKSQTNELLELAGLEGSGDRRIGGYSKGMQQRLGVAQSLIGSPELLILDEPTAGLDPEGRAEVRRVIKRVGEGGTTVFLSSHLLEEVEKICTHVTIIDEGRALVSGTMEEVSEKFPKRTEIVVEVAELVEGLGRSIGEIPRVERVTPRGKKLVILAEKGEGIRREVSRAISDVGGEIVGMEEKRRTLEEAFLEAVKEGSE